MFNSRFSTSLPYGWRTFASSFVGVASLYAIGVPLTLLTTIVLARVLTVEGFGLYGFALSIASVLSVPLTAGVPTLLTREIARYAQVGNWAAYRGLIWSAYGWVITATFVFLCGAWVLVSRSSVIENEVVYIVLAIFPFIALTAVRSGILKGLGRPFLAEMPLQLIQPLILLVGFVWLGFSGSASPVNALIWYAVTVAVVFAIATVIFFRVQPSDSLGVHLSTEDRAIWIKALPPFALMGAVGVLSAQVALIMLGLIEDEEAVAYLRVAERGAFLVVFPLHIAAAILGPYFVRALQSGDTTALTMTSKMSSRIIFGASVSIALVLAIIGEWLIAISFGPEYGRPAYNLMMILVTAQLVSSAFGASGMLLAMSGHERLTLLSQSVGLFTIIVATIPLISSFGATGAAVGAGAGILANRTIELFAVRLKLGFWPSIF